MLSRLYGLPALGCFAAAITLAFSPALATEGADSATALPEPQKPEITWDRVTAIREAGARIGALHRAKGPRGAYQFIDACYRTHSLAEKYGQYFESCIVQDYLETRIVVQVYSQLPPEALAQSGAAKPGELANAMGERIVAALKQYNLPASHGDELKQLADEHGLPAFLAVASPPPERKPGEASPEVKQANPRSKPKNND